jgi:type VI secretion system secreted protein VgrG
MADSAPPPMSLMTVLEDVLLFRSLSATEEMGRLFEFNVVALSDADEEVDTTQLLGTDASVTIELADGKQRHFHGLVVRAGLESTVGRMISWRLQLRPWLWQLTRRSDSRIYQNKKVEDIIKDVFAAYPNLDVDWQLEGSFAPRPYCVQYRETDFNFVSRLMEEEGIYYFHRHTADTHTLVICNKMTKHEAFAGYETIKFRQSQDQLLELEAITDWRHTSELTSGKVTLTDYDYLKPGTSLKVEKTSEQDTADALLEHYDYPGLYTETARGTELALVRQQELDSRVLRVSGYTTTVGALTVGHSFELEDHPLKAENKRHVVLSTRTDAQYSGYESGQGQTQFSCRFSAMRYAHVFRPERITPKPIIAGPQTAVVVGPSGEEIYTDQYGRAKVKFHWDRLNDGEHDKKSCWVRVSSTWAGKGWGQISLPRIGQEVVVDFLEGDPDLPLITGRVYNAVQVVPYKLPDNKTVSTLKSQSSVGGTTANANELRFEDKKGDEYVWFQAEKDMKHLVKNNADTRIGNAATHYIGGTLTEQVVGKHQATYDDEQNILIKKKHQTEIKEDSTYYVGGAFKLSAGDTSVKAGGTGVSLGSLDLAVQQGVKIKGMSIDIKADTKVSIEAGVQISLKAGGNFVDIGPAGVAINGTMVLINSGGAASPAAAASPSSPSKGPEPKAPAELKDPLPKS